MQLGIDAEKDTLQSLIRSCLLELNKLKYDLTELEVERANDNTPQRIKELEKDIVDKEKEVSVIKFKAEDEINLLKKQLDDVLAKAGVEEIKAEGEQFDPEFHNAVMHEDDETLGENVVKTVLQKGYKRGDKILRYSMVIVAN